jgi:hypothetical protein
VKKKVRYEITDEAEADYRESVDFYSEDNREIAPCSRVSSNGR